MNPSTHSTADGVISIPQLFKLALATLLLVLVWIVVRPFTQPFLWSIVLATAAWPLFKRIRSTLAPRYSVAAGLCALAIGILGVVVIILLPLRVARELQEIAGSMKGFSPEFLAERLQRIPYIGSYFSDAIRSSLAGTTDVKEILAPHMASLVSLGTAVAQQVINSIVTYIGALVGCYFLFVYGEVLLQQTKTAITKLGWARVDETMRGLNLTVRGAAYGVVSTSIAQGTLAGLGFAAAGVSTPVLFGILTALLSFIPFGAPVVYVPVSLYVLFLGDLPWYYGVGLLAWGILVVGTVDNFLRSFFISQTTNVSGILVFIGVLGGVIAFGLLGVFIGPAMIGIAQRIWVDFVATPSPSTRAE